MAPDYYDAGFPDEVLADLTYFVGHCDHSGPPGPDKLVECECACGCTFLGRFDEVIWTDRMLRCRPCMEMGHPSRLRWDANAT